MKQMFLLITIVALLSPALYAQSEEEAKERERQRERETARAEELLRDFELKREKAEAIKAEFEAQAHYEEALRMREMEEHLKGKHKELQKVLNDLQAKEKSTTTKSFRICTTNGII